MNNVQSNLRPAKIKNFRDLEIWALGKKISIIVYSMTEKFPQKELYGLVSQLRRAAVSVPSNIAEGFNRFHNKEYKQFLYIALGSCAELETQLEISLDLGYFTNDEYAMIQDKLVSESKMIRSLINKL